MFPNIFSLFSATFLSDHVLLWRMNLKNKSKYRSYFQCEYYTLKRKIPVSINQASIWWIHEIVDNQMWCCVLLVTKLFCSFRERALTVSPIMFYQRKQSFTYAIGSYENVQIDHFISFPKNMIYFKMVLSLPGIAITYSTNLKNTSHGKHFRSKCEKKLAAFFDFHDCCCR